jgi:hypothetical protein
MQTMTLQAHVGPDGVLKLEIPTGLTDVELDVVLTFHPRSPLPATPHTLKELIGSIDDPTFVRHPQGDYPQREPLE